MKNLSSGIVFILYLSCSSALNLGQKWGVKDLTDEVVAYQKMSYIDQEKSDINDSLREAEAELGHKIGEPDKTTQVQEGKVTNESNDND